MFDGKGGKKRQHTHGKRHTQDRKTLLAKAKREREARAAQRDRVKAAQLLQAFTVRRREGKRFNCTVRDACCLSVLLCCLCCCLCCSVLRAVCALQCV